MSEPPTFSVLVPAYNHARYLPATLDSLVAQTDADWEAVVVNDGSTDDTPRVLEAYAAREPRVRVFHQQNGGQSVALNRAIRESRGSWLLWLSADDLFLPSKLAVHRDWITRETGARFSFTRSAELHDATGEVRPVTWNASAPDPEWMLIGLMASTFINGISVCIARETMMDCGGFNESLRYAQDYDLWLRILGVSRGVHIPEVTCLTRRHAGQVRATSMKACLYESGLAAIEFLNKHPLPAVFPLVSLERDAGAEAALHKAFDVASSPHSFLYALGVNEALVLSMMRWLWSDRVPVALRGRFRQRAGVSCKSHRGGALGCLFGAAYLAAHCADLELSAEPVVPLDVGTRHHRCLRGRDAEEASAVAEYLVHLEPGWSEAGSDAGRAFGGARELWHAYGEPLLRRAGVNGHLGWRDRVRLLRCRA